MTAVKQQEVGREERSTPQVPGTKGQGSEGASALASRFLRRGGFAWPDDEFRFDQAAFEAPVDRSVSAYRSYVDCSS